MLATICLIKLANIFRLNPSKIVHGHRKIPVPESFFNKVRPQSATLLRKKFWRRCFSVNFTKFLRKLFLQNTSGRQFLQIHVPYIQHIC